MITDRANRHMLILLCMLFFLLLYVCFTREADHWDRQGGRKSAAGLYCALIVPKPSKCQRCLQGTFTLRLRCVSIWFYVYACAYMEEFLFSPTSDSMLWSCLSLSMKCFMLELLTEQTVPFLSILVCFGCLNLAQVLQHISRASARVILQAYKGWQP